MLNQSKYIEILNTNINLKSYFLAEVRHIQSFFKNFWGEYWSALLHWAQQVAANFGCYVNSRVFTPQSVSGYDAKESSESEPNQVAGHIKDLKAP